MGKRAGEWILIVPSGSGQKFPPGIFPPLTQNFYAPFYICVSTKWGCGLALRKHDFERWLSWEQFYILTRCAVKGKIRILDLGCDKSMERVRQSIEARLAEFSPT